MTKYCYDVTGDYKDDLKMEKDDIVIHDGNLLGLITYTNGRLELNLNYGKNVFCPCELKKIDDMVITVPHKDYLNNNDYFFIPLIFEPAEYEQFIEITYIDRPLLDNIQQMNKEDISNLVMMRFKIEFSILETLSTKEIIENIVACSQEDDKVSELIQRMLNNEISGIKKIEERDKKYITLFIDFQDVLYEWNTVFKFKGDYYFKLVDDYAIKIK